MRAWVMMVFAAVLIFGAGNYAVAAEKTVTKKRSAASEPEQPRLSDQQRAQIADEAVKTLSSQPLKIFIFPQGGVAGAIETDTLVFTSTTVTAEGLKAKGGYNGSNFSLTVQDDGAVIWETVQRNAEKSFVMWRGELRGSGVNGIMNVRSASGTSTTYAFSTDMPKSAPVQRAVAQAVTTTHKVTQAPDDMPK